MGFSRYKIVLVLLLAVILTVTVLSRSRLQQETIVDVGPLVKNAPSALSGSIGYREDNSERDDVVPYKQGKEIIYRPRTDCIKPKLLKDYRNPCWISTQARKQLVCTAKVTLLGFHKSGTTDLSRWFKSHGGVLYTAGDLFKDKGFTSQCPLDWLQNFNKAKRQKDWNGKTTFDDCPGCVLISKVLRENTTHIIRQSAIQYLQYTMVEESRYIITMREPADRMISHFFYLHKIQRSKNPYNKYRLEEIGNAFFHEIVMETTTTVQKCLKKYGTTSCILEPQLFPIKHPNKPVNGMITLSCYATHLKEVFKFIPKEKIYFSKLDEYSENEIEAIKRIYEFVGVSTASLNTAGKSKQNMKVINAGYKTKPVLPETVEVLQKFYSPFNVELATLLGDDKWLWQ